MIRYDQDPSGFTIFFRERAVISHTRKRPCVMFGRGEETITAKHGVYRLKKDRITEKAKATDFAIRQDGGTLAVEFPGLATMNCREESGRILVTFENYSDDCNRFWFRVEAGRDEHVYGCGERFGKLDLRGQDIPIWVTEPGVGRGRDYVGILAELHSGRGGAWHNTYFPMPTFVASGNWYVHTDATSYSRFDFRKKDHFTLYFWQVPDTIFIGVHDTAPEAVQGLSDLLGRQPELPDWAYDGMWLACQGGTERVRSKVDEALGAGIKLAAIWSQDWEGIRKTPFGTQLFFSWEYDPELFPGLPDFIQELKGKGVRFLGYNNCFIDFESPFFKEGEEKGYFVKDPEGKVYELYTSTYPVAMVDLTNPEGCIWFKKMIKKNMIDIGMGGWMADYGEYLPFDAQLHDGEAMLYHNTYPADWARLNKEAIEEAGRLGEVLFFSRSGFTGSSTNSLMFWGGDQLVTFHKNNGLETVIPAGISMGMCGCGYYHFDIGCFLSIAWVKRSAEIWMRSAEMAAFTQTMRSHEGINPEVNQQFNSSPEILAHLKKMTTVYTRLKDYHRHLGMEYREQGLPPMRHPYIHYEGDPVLHRLPYQYLYGRDLMVAPVVKKGRKRWRVYLPDDRWVHLWTGSEYGQGWHTVPAPVGEPPLFYREESEFAPLFSELRQG